ncbi:MAG: hypothetical protein KIY10_10040 [Thermoplasmata archaeon]|nr:hypothetical protein [Candidatus Sysuiplasma jiujiangense]MBX8642901.1 hypothetical protein [Candidatus Sysuiplasma jiujiangense]
MAEDGKKKNVIRSFRLDEDLNDWMEEKHISIGKLINSLVREYMEKELGKQDPHASKKDLTSPDLSHGGSTCT